MDFSSFIGGDKQEIEASNNFLLCRKFLSPSDLEEFKKKGWKLISIASAGQKLGYYFEKVK